MLSNNPAATKTGLGGRRLVLKLTGVWESIGAIVVVVVGKGGEMIKVVA
jgi:hypothetical protein